MVVRSSGSSHHLVELLHREPVDSHGQRIEDDLACREVHTGRKSSGRDNTGKFSFLELLFHLAAFLRCQTGMVRRSH